MTYHELLYQLKQWEAHNPELLSQPALFIPEPGDEPIEIDGMETTPVGDMGPDERVTEDEILILTP